MPIGVPHPNPGQQPYQGNNEQPPRQPYSQPMPQNPSIPSNGQYMPMNPPNSYPSSQGPPQAMQPPQPMAPQQYQGNTGAFPQQPPYGAQYNRPMAPSQPAQQFAAQPPYQQMRPPAFPQSNPSSMPSFPSQPQGPASYHQQTPNMPTAPMMQRPPMQNPGYPQPQQVSPPGAPFPSTAAPVPSTQQASTRINPGMIPSPVTVNEADQSKFNETSFVTSSIGVQSPPLPTTMARYIDDGNSSARFMRLTTYNVPCTEDILHASRMPLALVVQPFAQRPSYEVAIFYCYRLFKFFVL